MALAWMHCNRRKGPNLAGMDPDTSEIAHLFHPRRERWRDRFNGPDLRGKTEIGPATIQALAINDPSFRAVRIALRNEGILDRD
jgi:hypothetical protein